MNAAFTLVLLFAFSTTIVRISSTILRHTGLPDNIARFQSISALSGTGFTTSESELIVNFPVRRRVLIFLMILGNLGMASVATTFIVALIATEGETGAVLTQVVAFVIAIGLTLLIMSNKTLDKKLCDGISWYLTRSGSLELIGFERLYQISHNYSIAEHLVEHINETSLADLNLEEFELVVLGVRTGADKKYLNPSEVSALQVGDKLVCYGAENAHKRFVKRYSVGA